MESILDKLWPITKERPSRARIFQSELLEKGTFAHPLAPFIFWIPVIMVIFYYQNLTYQSGLLAWSLMLFSGVLAWTFAEYWIHRIFFHLDLKSDWGKRIIYIVHGNHHEDPADPWRGVMPILPAVLYVAILYGLFALIVPTAYLNGFMGSFLVGYLLYDGIHYFTHHGNPKSSIGKYLRKSHLIHHVHEERRFGISTPLWDFIFRTN